MVKYFLRTLLLFFLISSCSSSFHKQYYQELKGSWTINQFEHIQEETDTLLDLRRSEDYFQIGFENQNNLFFIKRENRENKFIGAKYFIFKENDTLKIRIEESEDVRIEGVYDLYMDTIRENEMQFLVQISLDEENTYISAQKWKNK